MGVSAPSLHRESTDSLINTVIIVGIVTAKYNRCSNYQNTPCGKAVEVDKSEQEE